jgi:hypothetical protein
LEERNIALEEALEQEKGAREEDRRTLKEENLALAADRDIQMLRSSD